ncbi:TolB family protein [Tenacibaculum xiamenense]|uniref:TolB family protein n=1 Tax=Tenacibaculum xiamenense TaxID=1261553 RepID=UPI00389497ED
MKQIVIAIIFLSLNHLVAQETNYEIRNLEINTRHSEIGPTFYENNTLVFARPAASNASKKAKFFNLYQTNESPQFYSKKKRVTPFSKEINTIYHESNAVFTKDYKTIYFTKTNAKKRKPGKRDSRGSIVLKIYKATNVNGKWKDIVELPFNSDNYSVGHPALSNDDQKLYFTSNMPGTHGESDIFVVDILGDNKYSTPRNLGSKVNTKGKEMFPFVDENNNLYFSSDSHKNNKGGLDIYCSKFENNKYSAPQSLGVPINSDADDFGFIKRNGQNSGYFASNRYGGKGGDDIYSFTQNTSVITLTIDLD